MTRRNGRHSLASLRPQFASRSTSAIFRIFRSPGQVEENILQAGFSLAHLSQIIHASGCDQFALVYDANPVAHPLSDLKDVRGKKYCRAALRHLLQEILYQAGGSWSRPTVGSSRTSTSDHASGLQPGMFLLHAVAVRINRVRLQPAGDQKVSKALRSPVHLPSCPSGTGCHEAQ